MPPVSPMVAHALILATALLLYLFAWKSVGSLPRAIRGVARLVLLLILIAPIALFVLFGTQMAEHRDVTMSKPPVDIASEPKGGSGPSGAGGGIDKSRPVFKAERSIEPPAPPSVPRGGEAVPEAKPAEPKIATAPPPPAPAAVPPPEPVVGAPSPVGATQPGPAADTAASADWAVVPVFYGTDRSRIEDPKRLKYAAGRAGKLELGRALITVPKTHQVPNIERPWAIKVPFFDITIYEQAEDPKTHFTIKEIASYSKSDFLSLVRARLAASKRYENQAVVFIHGYNTDFDFAVYRTAQMAYDLDFDGVPFLYSWPSGTGITGYVADRESAEQAEPYLREFIEMVVKETGAKSVSVIAHSMGNLPLLRTLRDMAPTMPEGVKFDQIVLAAPDVDRNVFEQLARDLAKMGQGVTLYASSSDRAMDAARRVARVPRAGDVPAEGPVIVPGIDTIDITAVSTDAMALNHSSYAESSALLNDIGLLLRTRERPPEKRIPILEKITIDRGDYWRYPK